MNATEIRWGHGFAVDAATPFFLWAVAEWPAYRLAPKPELGAPWFSLLAWRFNLAHALFRRWFGYDA
jgi:hypothetical protein